MERRYSLTGKKNAECEAISDENALQEEEA
jgi:hypothetical protein